MINSISAHDPRGIFRTKLNLLLWMHIDLAWKQRLRMKLLVGRLFSAAGVWKCKDECIKMLCVLIMSPPVWLWLPRTHKFAYIWRFINILYVQSVGFAWGSPTKISVKLNCWFIKWKFIGTVKYADPVLASSLTLRADHYLTPILTAILPLLPGLLTVKRESCVTDTRQSPLPLSNFGPVPKPLEELQTRGRYQCFHTGLTTICNADCTCRG